MMVRMKVDGSGKRLKMTTTCLSGRTLESVIKKRDRFLRYFLNGDAGNSDDYQQGSSVTSLARKIDIQRAPVREKASRSS